MMMMVIRWEPIKHVTTSSSPGICCRRSPNTFYVLRSALANTRDFNFIQLNRSRRKGRERRRHRKSRWRRIYHIYSITSYCLVDRVLVVGWWGKEEEVETTVAAAMNDTDYIINVCTVSDEGKVSSCRRCWWSVQCQVQLLRFQTDRRQSLLGWKRVEKCKQCRYFILVHHHRFGYQSLWDAPIMNDPF